MKNLSITLAVIGALTLGAFTTAQARNGDRHGGAHKQRPAAAQHRAAPRKFQRAVDQRQAKQRGRIKHGYRSGTLNHKQVARLRHEQRRINKLERRFGADGRYSRHERRVIKHKLHRANKRIWRMKGNHYRHAPVHRKHRRFQQYFGQVHAPHAHVQRVYPVYQEAPSESLGLDIETEEFRFSVNKSG